MVQNGDAIGEVVGLLNALGGQQDRDASPTSSRMIYHVVSGDYRCDSHTVNSGMRRA